MNCPNCKVETGNANECISCGWREKPSLNTLGESGTNSNSEDETRKTAGARDDPNQPTTPNELKKKEKDTKSPGSNDVRYYGRVGVGVGNASNSTFNSYFGGQRPEEEKGLFELVTPLPPRKSSILQIVPEELNQKIGELREKRLILISCADEALAYAAAYAAFDKLGADEQQRYMLKFDSKSTETASLSINLFCEESKNSKAETIFLLDASSDSAKSFIDSLLPFGNWLWFDDVLSRNNYLIICIVNQRDVKNSLKRLKFPHWNLDLLHCLPPSQLVHIVHLITDELIKYIKNHPDVLYEIRPRQFEELVAEILASYGWEVQLTPPIKDGGYDIFAISRDIAGVRTSWIIECKKYRPENKVGVDIARALYGVKSALHGVANAMLATTSYFTQGVKYFKASRYDFELRDYEGILEWINTYRPNPNGQLYIKDNKLIVPDDE